MIKYYYYQTMDESDCWGFFVDLEETPIHTPKKYIKRMHYVPVLPKINEIEPINDPSPSPSPSHVKTIQFLVYSCTILFSMITTSILISKSRNI